MELYKMHVVVVILSLNILPDEGLTTNTVKDCYIAGNATVQENIAAEFQCTAVGLGFYPKMWLLLGKHGYNSTGTGRIRHFHVYFKRMDNKGALSCVCDGTELKRSKSMTLDVQFVATNITMHHHEPYVIENHKVTLACTTTSSNPATDVVWYENNSRKKNNHEPDRTSGEFYGTVTTQKYTTMKLQRHEEREIKCCTNGAEHTCSHVWVAHVEYAPSKPSITQDPDGDPQEGDNVTLTCESDAYPITEKFITWFKEDSPKQGVPNGQYSLLDLPQVTKEDSGHYYCEANNFLGDKNSAIYELKVQYSPEVSSTSDTCTEATNGKDITLHCEAQSLPIPTVKWYDPNGHLVEKGVNETIVSKDPFLGTTVLGQLTIPGIKSDDDYGEFTCNASNVVGFSVLKVTVTDTCPDHVNLIEWLLPLLFGVISILGLFFIIVSPCGRNSCRRLANRGQCQDTDPGGCTPLVSSGSGSDCDGLETGGGTFHT